MDVKNFKITKADPPCAPLAVSNAGATGSARVAFAGTPNDLDYVIVNTGSKTAYVKNGDSTVTAAITDIPILPGAYVGTFSRNQLDTHIAALCAGTDTTTLIILSGQGT